MFEYLRRFVLENITLPFWTYSVKRLLRKRNFHKFMLCKEGKQWIDFLEETSNPFEKFSLIPADYAGYDTGTVFWDIYKNNAWGNSESRSGPGSSLKETEHVRSALPLLLKKYGIKTFVDIPCGDWNWMKTVDLSESGVERYVGGDLVSDIITENKKQFGNARRQFDEINLVETPLPQGDLLLCRDCLVHLSYADIKRFLSNLHKGGIRYLLTTTFTDHPSNHDIQTGAWRPLNLEKPSFGFPRPLEIIIENSTARGQGKNFDKSLGLWEIAALPEPLSNK